MNRRIQKWMIAKELTLIERIQEGWSNDEKYIVQTNKGIKYLLRISLKERIEERQAQFDYMKQFAQTTNTCQVPIEFGSIPSSTYIFTLLTYIEGQPLEKMIASLSIKKQYELGLKAGNILGKFHEILIQVNQEEAIQRLIQKKRMQLEKYEQSEYRIQGDEQLITYVKSQIQRVKQQPIVLQHGDFHIGNFIYTPNNELGIIDFDRSDLGDPYEEFLKLAFFSRESSIPFSQGQITGYFKGEVPENFWEILKVYVFHTSMYAIIWASNFSQSEVDGMIVRYKRVLEDYDNGQLLIPKWWKDGHV